MIMKDLESATQGCAGRRWLERTDMSDEKQEAESRGESC